MFLVTYIEVRDRIHSKKDILRALADNYCQESMSVLADYEEAEERMDELYKKALETGVFRHPSRFKGGIYPKEQVYFLRQLRTYTKDPQSMSDLYQE
jgi:hypothetical protein